MARPRRPLSLSLPLSVLRHDDPSVSAFLWGLLPDNDRVLQRWARRFQVSARNAFSLLSTTIGEDCPGAVQLVTEDRVSAATDYGGVEWLTEDDVATRLSELRLDATAWLPDTGSGQFSLAGAQAKTALLYDDEREQWGLASGAVPTTHILKPATHGFDDHDLNEHLCLATAQLLGTAAVDTSVQRFGDVSAIVVRRYDRLRRDGRWIRFIRRICAKHSGFFPPRSIRTTVDHRQ